MNELIAASGHLIVTIGAGPAGIYGARKLAEAGHQVVLINRDIKPGGLVEYGIYFNKHKLKEGVRKQFRMILADPRVHYFGNVRIGQQADLTIEELLAIFQPSALVVAAGAQGTKALGIPGDKADGVYHAKDVVYHYNGLPAFSQKDFRTGDRVAVIGVGNVMVDIAHWLVHERKVREVVAIARRGPNQRAYTDIEIQSVAANIDATALRDELDRIGPRLEAVGEDLDATYKALLKHGSVRAKEGESPTRMTFRFLSAPTEIITNDAGEAVALRVENTELIQRGESLAAKGTGTYDDLPINAVVFAIGDRVDETLGLPCSGTEYIRNTQPHATHAGDEAYEVFDPATGEVQRGVFVIGWSRQASDGLVGKAKQDGERGVVAVNHHLETVAPGSANDAGEKLARFQALLAERGVQWVGYDGVQKLEAIERAESEARSVEFFKFRTNEEMLAAIR